MNRLAKATSPYLRQHAENPVDWFEWDSEALARAKERDVPILLSVGYAACHWCHVMAHESFEDAATAAFMNQHFVNIKVDREERPDIDAVYMAATQAMTGQGGWPMTCMLTPGGEPFFAGTYFPPEPRHGMPSFTQVLQALSEAWTNRREEVMGIGANVVAHLASTNATTNATQGQLIDASGLDEAAGALAGQYDSEADGFGTSPKFPPTMVLEFMLRHAARTGSRDVLAMAANTCEAMARGGIYDQIGGGFARYSVDRFWRVPHFEKMLYDNAQLLSLYLHLWRQTGSPLARRVAVETADFLLAEMQTPQGGFASALDADTDGSEGVFYVWTPAQLTEVLGPDDGVWAAELLTVTAAGTFEAGASTLQRHIDPDDLARWDRVRAALYAARSQRTNPARDDKVVAGWNGLAISALVEAGVLLHDSRYTDAAIKAAALLHDLHMQNSGLLRVSREGVAGDHAGVLEDYGLLAHAWLAVLSVTGDVRWLERARLLLDKVLERFRDDNGGFFDTAADAQRLVMRPKDLSDNASPAGNSAAAAAFVALAAVTGESGYRDAADSALGAMGGTAAQAPRFAGCTLGVAEAMLAGPFEVAIVGAEGQRDTLLTAALSSPSPGAVIVAAAEGTAIPLFEDRMQIDDKPAAYVCRGFVCSRPVTTASDLESALSGG